MNFDHFNGIIWQSSSHGKLSGRYRLKQAMCCVIAIAASVSPVFLARYLGALGTIFILFVLPISVVYIILLSNWKIVWDTTFWNFASSKGHIMFSDHRSKSYFYESYDNVGSYAYREEKNGLASVIIYFKKPASAGTMGKLKEIRMFGIENFDKLRAVLEENHIQKIPFPDEKI